MNRQLLQQALEPVALESVHLTRDTRGMCVVRVNGRIAIRDNGDIIDHMATLEWFATPPAPQANFRHSHDRSTPPGAAPPAAPAPAVRESQDDLIESVIRDVAELDYSSPEGMPDVMLVTADELRGILHRYATASPAAPAQPAVPLTEGRITGIANELAFGGGHCNVYELARAIEAAHGITGGKP